MKSGYGPIVVYKFLFLNWIGISSAISSALIPLGWNSDSLLEE